MRQYRQSYSHVVYCVVEHAISSIAMAVTINCMYSLRILTEGWPG